MPVLPPPTPPTDRAVRFAAVLDRVLARERQRDPDTGLTAGEAEAERAYLGAPRQVRRRVQSPHVRVR